MSVHMARKKETEDIVLLREFFLSDDPCLVTTEVAAAVNMTRQGVSSRLKELAREGWLNSKKPSRDRIYWLTDSGETRAKDSLKSS